MKQHRECRDVEMYKNTSRVYLDKFGVYEGGCVQGVFRSPMCMCMWVMLLCVLSCVTATENQGRAATNLELTRSAEMQITKSAVHILPLKKCAQIARGGPACTCIHLPTCSCSSAAAVQNKVRQQSVCPLSRQWSVAVMFVICLCCR